MAEIVRLDGESADELHALLAETWEDTYRGILSDSIIRTAASVWHSADTLRRQMKNKDILFAGCRDDGRLVGMVRAASVDETTARIFQLYVLPSQQRKGIGTKLMDHATNFFPQARVFVVDVAKGNENGVSFYRRYGFEFTGEMSMKVGDEEIQHLIGTLRR